ncbi:MAG: DUF2183 domain-containing protein [Gemmatimonadaceae bacterium]|nr:DUF2183 domain-containing protein [Gemmatimonadaceae bacterium]
MSEWTDDLDALRREVSKTLGAAARAVRSALDNDPHEILAYRGYGNAVRAHINGRVLEHRGVSVSSDADSTLRNLLNTYRRADSDPLPFASLAVDFRGAVATMKSDDEGFFSGWVDTPGSAPSSDEWQTYGVKLVAPLRSETEKVEGKGEILVPKASARFGVISDLDDTVIQSRVSNFLQAARTVMLGNARTRLPFPGVAGFYQALRRGAGGDEKNPIFYVSSSPWNIYDVIAEFMELQKIPSGPILLRDWDVAPGALSPTRHFDHKSYSIRSIMQLYPELPFILVGDTSQHDPEIYQQVVREFPGRIKAIYIRDVTLGTERSAAVTKLAAEIVADKSVLVLAEDTLGAAKHALEQGWIAAEELPQVQEEKRADEGRDDSKVAAPGGGEVGAGEPAAVIE